MSILLTICKQLEIYFLTRVLQIDIAYSNNNRYFKLYYSSWILIIKHWIICLFLFLWVHLPITLQAIIIKLLYCKIIFSLNFYKHSPQNKKKPFNIIKVILNGFVFINYHAFLLIFYLIFQVMWYTYKVNNKYTWVLWM